MLNQKLLVNAIGEITGIKVNSGPQLKLLESACTLAPADKQKKTV